MSQPQQFEHYQLLKHEDGTFVELGHGAMGVTYKAFDTNLRCHVALKVISAAHLNDATAAERFLREARGAAQLRHRNVATVFHLGRNGDSYFYAMEFIEGETVDACVKRDGPMNPLLALEVTSQVAAALVAAQKQGLIHRDIKPSNLMLVHEDDGELIVKVIDFGLVKSALIGSTAGALTSTGFVGTPYFASPEQLDQRSEDIRTDIYSLGVTLWFMLTGKPTFMGSVASVIAQHLDKVPAFESLAVLPTCVVGVLRMMLEKDVEERIQTPNELRAELKRSIEILKASKTEGSSEPKMMTYDEAFETIGLSSTRGLHQPQARAGTVLSERYRLIMDLDQAHPGRSFHAEDLQQKRRVRIRIVQCDLPAFNVLRDQTIKLQQVTQRNFVTILAAERTGNFGYLVSEWLEGFSLVDLLRARHELTLRETLTLLEQIAPAVDAARELEVRLALCLRDVFIHFPEGFSDPDGQVILRCPLAEWPAFVVKMDPLGEFEEFDDQSACERTMAATGAKHRPSPIAHVASLAYDLLGGKPGSSGPLATVSEEGNGTLRRGLSPNGGFSSASEFVQTLGHAAQADVTARPGQSGAAAPAPRTGTPAPAPSPAKPSRSSSSKATPPRKKGPSPFLVFGGLAAALVVAGTISFFLAGGGSPSPHPKQPGTTGQQKATPAVAQRQPPQPGTPWKNSLDMRYVPVGDMHFAATETRVKDFQAFVDATGFDAEGGMYSLQKDGFKQHGHSWKNPGFPQSPEHPVVGISYEDARYFCEWLTKKERNEGGLTSIQFYRLPTDREWSEAAGLKNESGATPEDRSGKVKIYIWGTAAMPDNVANFAGSEAAAGTPAGWPTIPGYHDASARTRVVPGYGPNPLGIYDLAGNVWEWCQDSYNKANPNWRVLRGGSWATSKPEELLLSYRRGLPSEFRQDDIGFRCVIATDAGDR